MNMNNKSTSRAANFPKTESPQEFREIAENATRQVEQSYETMGAATKEANNLIQNSYSTAVKGVQDYNSTFFEFARENMNATFDFVKQLTAVGSPMELLQLSAGHARTQLATLTDQTTKLTALAQKVALASVDQTRAGVSKTLNHA